MTIEIGKDGWYRASGMIEDRKVGGLGTSFMQALENALVHYPEVCQFCFGSGKMEVGYDDNLDEVKCVCQVGSED